MNTITITINSQAVDAHYGVHRHHDDHTGRDVAEIEVERLVYRGVDVLPLLDDAEVAERVEAALNEQAEPYIEEIAA